MNIKELAEQAGIKYGKSFVYSTHSDLEGHSFSKDALAKFAALIVKECVNIADEYDGAGSTIVSRIKKHFGVEQ